MHSTFSYDGKVELSQLRDILLSHGVSFCCMTEHTDEMTSDLAAEFLVSCRELSDEQFVFIPGFEVPYNGSHVLHIGSTVFHGRKASSSSLHRWGRTSSFIVLAHPVRNNFEIDDLLAELIDGVEVWNQQYEGKHVPRPRSLELYRGLRQKNMNLRAVGGIDLHRKEHLGPPYVRMEIERLCETDIIEALQEGRYTFGSSGVCATSDGKITGISSSTMALKSTFYILIINTGRALNAFLSKFGLSLPKGLTQAVRSRV